MVFAIIHMQNNGQGVAVPRTNLMPNRGTTDRWKVVLQTTSGLGFNLYIASLLVVNDTALCSGL